MGRFKKILKNPANLFLTLGHRGFFNHMSDEKYLKIAYRCKMHRKLDLDNPQTFNEKLQWLKIHDKKPEYTNMVDKYTVRQYVSDRIGEEYLIPNLGVWDSFDQIDFDNFPSQFVLKTTHNSGGVIICRDKVQFDIGKARKKINFWMKHNSYWDAREWPYKNVKPRIIAEKYLVDESGYELKDYKFFCFDGVPKAMFIASDRSSSTKETKFDFYDMDFHHMPVKNGHDNADHPISKPTSFEEMKRIAAILSKGIPQVRVDLYDIQGKIYFGELTFFHWGGMIPFDPEEWDYKFGNWIDLSLVTDKAKQVSR